MDTGPERIALIVDDDSQTRRLMARFFQIRGFVALEAEDNAAAMEHLKLHQPAIITTDLNRSGGSGIEFITQVRAHPELQQVPILFISGNATAEQRRAAKQAGAFADLDKPFELVELEACVATVIPIRHPKAS